MSLINRMLQDLDARAGKPGAAPLPSGIRPVPQAEPGLPWKRVAIAAAVAGTVALAGLAGWRLWGAKPMPARVAPPPAVAKAPASVPPPAAPAEPARIVAIEIPVPPRQDEASARSEASPAPLAAQVAQAAPAAEPQSEMFGVSEPEPRAGRVAAKRVGQDRQPAKPAAPKARAGASSDAPKPAARGGRIETPAQRAENAYRRALASLEDGRVTEAIAGLQAALKLEPRHEAARQTLVSLLIEARRPEEALRQLGAALALDPRQPAMAMLMARLQLERGSPGIDTLLRTLPYAAGDGEYHAFLAGALAREGRHREAVEHYETALRTNAENGVWWMGLGISLQAEKRIPDAIGALQRARDSGTLSAQLQGFVERKLKQLGR